MPPRPAHLRPSVSPQQSAGYPQYPQYPQLHPQHREGIERLLSREISDTERRSCGELTPGTARRLTGSPTTNEVAHAANCSRRQIRGSGTTQHNTAPGFSAHDKGRYDDRHMGHTVTDLIARGNRRVGEEYLMTSPMDSGSALPPSGWRSSSYDDSRSQLMSLLRAGIIALVLLGTLALIVLI